MYRAEQNCVLNLSYSEFRNEPSWSRLWTSFGSVGQSVGCFSCRDCRCWIPGRTLVGFRGIHFNLRHIFGGQIDPHRYDFISNFVKYGAKKISFCDFS